MIYQFDECQGGGGDRCQRSPQGRPRGGLRGSEAKGPTIDDTALLGFLKDKLAAYKLPRKVMQMEALPRNATGKILKTKLREIAAEQFGR